MSVQRSYIGRRERALLRRLRRRQVDDTVGGLEVHNHNQTKLPRTFLIIVIAVNSELYSTGFGIWDNSSIALMVF